VGVLHVDGLIGKGAEKLVMAALFTAISVASVPPISCKIRNFKSAKMNDKSVNCEFFTVNSKSSRAFPYQEMPSFTIKR
jgi:hypothetical protein